MTIYRVLDRNGHILRYQARIERKSTGKLRQSFSTLPEAIAWVTKLHNEIPCASAGWATRGVRVRVERKKTGPINRRILDRIKEMERWL